MTYGKLVIEYELGKEETRALERKLSTNERLNFRSLSVLVTSIEVSEVGHNTQFITVKGIV